MSTDHRAVLRFGDPASIRERGHARMKALIVDLIEMGGDEVVAIVINELSEIDYQRFWETEDSAIRAGILFEAASGNPALAKRLGI